MDTVQQARIVLTLNAIVERLDQEAERLKDELPYGVATSKKWAHPQVLVTRALPQPPNWVKDADGKFVRDDEGNFTVLREPKRETFARITEGNCLLGVDIRRLAYVPPQTDFTDFCGGIRTFPHIQRNDEGWDWREFCEILGWGTDYPWVGPVRYVTGQNMWVACTVQAMVHYVNATPEAEIMFSHGVTQLSHPEGIIRLSTKKGLLIKSPRGNFLHDLPHLRLSSRDMIKYDRMVPLGTTKVATRAAHSIARRIVPKEQWHLLSWVFEQAEALGLADSLISEYAKHDEMVVNLDDDDIARIQKAAASLPIEWIRVLLTSSNPERDMYPLARTYANWNQYLAVVGTPNRKLIKPVSVSKRLDMAHGLSHILYNYHG